MAIAGRRPQIAPVPLSAACPRAIVRTGRGLAATAFADSGIVPDIVLSATDADVIKTYVGLALIPVPELFPANTTRIAVRRGACLRSYIHAFIEKVCPDLGEEAIKLALKAQAGGGLINDSAS